MLKSDNDSQADVTASAMSTATANAVGSNLSVHEASSNESVAANSLP